jgi:hypothetical protein
MENLTQIIKGAGALSEVLDIIGSNKTDHDMAKIVCDSEPELRELLQFALNEMGKR